MFASYLPVLRSNAEFASICSNKSANVRLQTIGSVSGTLICPGGFFSILFGPNLVPRQIIPANKAHLAEG